MLVTFILNSSLEIAVRNFVGRLQKGNISKQESLKRFIDSLA